jgi:hypothetical protein
MDRVSNPSHDSSLTEVFGGNVREDENNPTNHDFEIRRVNDGKVFRDPPFSARTYIGRRRKRDS